MKVTSTKKALALSVLSLVVCVSLLIGTTFAWFTDSVSSTNNIIKSGNLDVELYYQNAEQTTWKAVDEDTNVFIEGALWEPGHTEVIKLKVANEGTLALKYKLGINIASETGSVNVAGEEFKLSDYIYFGTIAGDVALDNRASAVAAVANAQTIKNGATIEGTKLAAVNNGLSEDVVTLVVYMPETVGNEANYAKGADIPTINLGINLIATQLAAEEDSFGSDYDKDAFVADVYVNDVTTLVDAITAPGSGVIGLTDDVVLDADDTITVTNNTMARAAAGKVIDLGGNTLYCESDVTGSNREMFLVKGDLTIKNGTIVMKHTGANMGWNSMTTIFDITAGGKVTLENVTAKNLGGSDMAFVAHLNNWGEATLNVNNSTLISTYCAVRVFNSGYDMNNVNITNTALIGNSSSVWVHNYTAADFGSQDKADAAAKLLNFNFVKDGEVNAAANNTFVGRIRYGFTNSEVIPTNAGGVATDVSTLNTTLANGGYTVLGNDVKDAATTPAPYGNKVMVTQTGGTFDGNGNTLSMTNGGDHYVVMTNGGTIKNLSIDEGFRGIVVMSPTEDVVIDNVHVYGEVCYALNTAEGDGTRNITVTNSTLNGWTSIGSTVKSVSFTNCSFGQGTYYTNVSGRLVKPYVSAVFENCEFSSRFYVDLSALVNDGTVTFKNCTVNGVKLTAENWKELIAPENTCGEGQISIEGRNGTYMTDSNVFDYVIIK